MINHSIIVTNEIDFPRQISTKGGYTRGSYSNLPNPVQTSIPLFQAPNAFGFEVTTDILAIEVALEIGALDVASGHRATILTFIGKDRWDIDRCISPKLAGE